MVRYKVARAEVTLNRQRSILVTETAVALGVVAASTETPPTAVAQREALHRQPFHGARDDDRDARVRSGAVSMPTAA
ncbi:hypothetical protein GCM10022255_085270 [Dactylosporangium darangshiense]|uniref:Uncharacterized protein n=1 Tax=Dactylosporangium darangshiense TaxID=579108 RepID=A0ABP8DN27_9ACTN